MNIVKAFYEIGSDNPYYVEYDNGLSANFIGEPQNECWYYNHKRLPYIKSKEAALKILNMKAFW